MIGNIVGHAYNLEASPHVIPRKGGGGDPKYLFLASLLELCGRFAKNCILLSSLLRTCD